MRLIDADAFKEYLKNALEEVKHIYPDGGEFARQITEDFCKDIDEQPTINAEPDLPIKPKCTVCPHCPNCDVNDDGTVKTAEPERLTDDDFEAIRIHLNAQKEKLCNQQRWEEAEEYQRIIDRFMAFASAEPEIIRCRDCKYSQMTDDDECRYCKIWFAEEEHFLPGDYYCADAERREE